MLPESTQVQEEQPKGKSIQRCDLNDTENFQGILAIQIPTLDLL